MIRISPRVFWRLSPPSLKMSWLIIYQMFRIMFPDLRVDQVIPDRRLHKKRYHVLKNVQVIVLHWSEDEYMESTQEAFGWYHNLLLTLFNNLTLAADIWCQQYQVSEESGPTKQSSIRHMFEWLFGVLATDTNLIFFFAKYCRPHKHPHTKARSQSHNRGCSRLGKVYHRLIIDMKISCLAENRKCSLSPKISATFPQKRANYKYRIFHLIWIFDWVWIFNSDFGFSF